MPRYCIRCILPEDRPGVLLDAEGVCRGCRNAEAKRRIDWSERSAAFDRVVEHARSRAASYDCVIPVSGGKDSFWQVASCLERGLRPLCVTYAVPGRTELGTRNLCRLLELGVDHLELRIDPHVERLFVERAFRKTGIPGLVSHMAIYRWPLRVAVTHDIPLVIYGENSAFEYGSEDDRLVGEAVDARWLERFGVTAGTTAQDWADDDLPLRRLAAFLPVDEAVLAERGTRAVFLGYYLPWDPQGSLRVALHHGFQPRAEGARVGHYDYVNIDDDMIGVHHHPKWHKFGITRTWDTLSMEIRNGRMTREEAIAHLRARGDETPWDDIAVFCDYLGISQRDYFSVVEGFRNASLWTRRDRRWVIDGFLVPDFPWPADPEPRA